MFRIYLIIPLLDWKDAIISFNSSGQLNEFPSAWWYKCIDITKTKASDNYDMIDKLRLWIMNYFYMYLGI